MKLFFYSFISRQLSSKKFLLKPLSWFPCKQHVNWEVPWSPYLENWAHERERFVFRWMLCLIWIFRLFYKLLICFTYIFLDLKLNRDGRRVPFCYRGRQSDEARHTWWLCFFGIFVVPCGWVYPWPSVSPLYSTGIRGTVHDFSYWSLQYLLEYNL